MRRRDEREVTDLQTKTNSVLTIFSFCVSVRYESICMAAMRSVTWASDVLPLELEVLLVVAKITGQHSCAKRWTAVAVDSDPCSPFDPIPVSVHVPVWCHADVRDAEIFFKPPENIPLSASCFSDLLTAAAEGRFRVHMLAPVSG